MHDPAALRQFGDSLTDQPELRTIANDMARVAERRAESERDNQERQMQLLQEREQRQLQAQNELLLTYLKQQASAEAAARAASIEASRMPVLPGLTAGGQQPQQQQQQQDGLDPDCAGGGWRTRWW